jgi:hypothetical protein
MNFLDAVVMIDSPTARTSYQIFLCTFLTLANTNPLSFPLFLLGWFKEEKRWLTTLSTWRRLAKTVNNVNICDRPLCFFKYYHTWVSKSRHFLFPTQNPLWCWRWWKVVRQEENRKEQSGYVLALIMCVLSSKADTRGREYQCAISQKGCAVPTTTAFLPMDQFRNSPIFFGRGGKLKSHTVPASNKKFSASKVLCATDIGADKLLRERRKGESRRNERHRRENEKTFSQK